MPPSPLEKETFTPVFWDRLSELFVRHRRTLTVFVVGMTALSVAGLFPPLGPIQFDDRPHLVFKTAGPDYARLDQLNKDFGSDDGDCYVLVQATDQPHLFTPLAVKGLRHIVGRLKALEVPIGGEMVPAVDTLSSMAEVQVVRRQGGRSTQRPLLPEKKSGQSPEEFKAACDNAKDDALDHPLVQGRLLSADAKNTLLIARLNSKMEQVSQFGLAVDEFRKLAKEVEVLYGLRMRTTGVPPIRVEISRSIVFETSKFTLIALVLASVMGFVLFRRVSLVVLTCIGPWCGALWTLGVMGLIGEPLNIVTVVLPILVVVVGFTNAIHLVVDMRQALAQGKTAMQAAAGAVRLIGGACGLAALTTAVGFGSLIASQSEIIQRFGLVCGGGALMSFLAVVTTVPLLATVLLRTEEGRPERATSGGLIGRFVDRLVDRVIGHRHAMALTGLVVTAALASTALWLKPDTMLTETIPRDREVAETLDAVDEIFGGAIVAIIHLEWKDDGNTVIHDIVDALTDVEQIVVGHPDLKHPISTLNLLRSLPGGRKRPASQWVDLGIFPDEVRERFMHKEKPRAILVSRIRNTGAASHEPVYQLIESRLEELEKKHPAFTMRLTGMPVVAARTIHQMIWDLATSLSLAGVVIFGVITLSFRSPRLGAISILPNVFPLVVTSAVLAFTGRPLQLATVIVFTICLGIAVDDTIHLINRFRREFLESGDVDGSLRRSGRAVGTALVTSTIVLLVGFGSMMFAEVPATLLFAWFTSIGIGAALIGDLVFLPALLAWFVKSKPKAQRGNDWDPPLSTGHGDGATSSHPQLAAHQWQSRQRYRPPGKGEGL